MDRRARGGINLSARKGDDICVVGVGAATSIGRTAPASAAAVRAGISLFGDHPYMIDQNGDPFVVAMASYLRDDLSFEQRLIELALPAAQEALSQLDVLSRQLDPIPLLVGLPSIRPGVPQELTSRLSEQLGQLTKNRCIVSPTHMISAGHSAGLMAIEVGSEIIQTRRATFCLVGGVDSYIDPDTLEWLESRERLHRPDNAYGFIPGEAAGFCLLCSTEDASRYGLPILSRLVAIRTAHEDKRITAQEIRIGEGLSKSVMQVVSSVHYSGAFIDHTICDLNGERYRAEEFGFMLARTSKHFADPGDYLAPADCWGDVGAASGPLCLMLTVAAAQKGYARGTHTLLLTSSESTERTAALFYSDVQNNKMA